MESQPGRRSTLCFDPKLPTDNVKLSNFYYEQLVQQKACHCAFTLMVLLLQVKASYMRYNIQKMEEISDEGRDSKFGDVAQLLCVSNILSIFQIYN